MNNIGIVDAGGNYREIILAAGDEIIPLRPNHEWDGSAKAWVRSPDPEALLGVMSPGNEYREIPLTQGEQVVPTRPSPHHAWEGGAWVEHLPPRDIAAEVAAHALALKVGIVNATRTDGLTDPVTPEGLAAIEKRYQNLAADISADLGLAAAGAGPAVDPSRVETLKTIKAGFAFFEAVDAAAKAILDAGGVSDPIDTDARWPALPAS